jgi:hypothetical protein
MATSSQPPTSPLARLGYDLPSGNTIRVIPIVLEEKDLFKAVRTTLENVFKVDDYEAEDTSKPTRSMTSTA